MHPGMLKPVLFYRETATDPDKLVLIKLEKHHYKKMKIISKGSAGKINSNEFQTKCTPASPSVKIIIQLNKIFKYMEDYTV